ncbi:MAG: RNA polymerase sigma factor, partial [Gemmatimonadota bacterium]
PRDARVALALKTVGGFGVNEIARAFLVSGSAIAQRLVRARRRLKTGCVLLAMPDTNELPERLDAVLEVLYLMFNEGHSAAAGDDLVRAELCAEAIRLAELVAIHPVVGRPRVDALCALFLFQAARIPARMASGELIPLPLQDRSVWDRRLMRRALTHQRRSARGEAVTSYHLQAEIAGCHTLAASYEATDWPRILDCYDTLLQIDNSPVIAINRVVALAEVHGPGAGIQALSDLKEEGSLDNYYHLYAVESELLRRLGHRAEASQALETAMRLVKTSPVRRYLATRALNHVGSTEP